MSTRISRRDFLKLGALAGLGAAAPGIASGLPRSGTAAQGRKNVVVVIFDALSAYHLSLHGYRRETTPNLARLAERAVVYHRHFAGSNFTTSGTASLLTGTLPWTHRALLNEGKVAAPFVSRNLFSLFEDYSRIAYTHNGWAYTLLQQFRRDIETLIPPSDLFYSKYDNLIDRLFDNDDDIASVSWARNMKLTDGYAYSLWLARPYKKASEAEIAGIAPLFPRGVPSAGADDSFLLEQAVDILGNELTKMPQPFLAYFHFYPPHAPYNTSREFFGAFRQDGILPDVKPVDVFAVPAEPDRRQRQSRTEYDEFILYADKEFGRLVNGLENAGLLKDTLVVFTSDHGEMFERGIRAHATETLYEPVIRIPLVILDPGRTSRMDIHTNTSAADVLPTLAHMTGYPVPDWSEGIVLPPFGVEGPDPDRPVYVARSIKTLPNAPLKRASTALIMGQYKLLYYFGYRDFGIDELVRLYDIQADREELVDLYARERPIAADMLAKLQAKIKQVNEPYL